jgi:hypothetical protein
MGPAPRHDSYLYRLMSFYPLHIRRESWTTFLLLVAGSCLLGLIQVATDGKVLASVAFLAVVCIVVLSSYRLDWGFYLFLGMVLVFDQFAETEFSSFTAKLGYFSNLKAIQYLPYFNSGVVTPFELHFLLLLFLWFVLICARKDYQLRAPAVWFVATVFFLWLIALFEYGLQNKGDLMAALWEVRALFYLGLMVFFVPQIIQTREQVQNVVWVWILGVSFKALEGTYRFVRQGFGMAGYDAMLNHEDPLFFITLLFLLCGLVLFGVKSRQRRFLTVMAIPMLIGFYVGNRRAAYGSLAASLLTFVSVLPGKQLWKFLKIVIPVAGLIAVYTIVFWDSEGGWATPIRQVRSGFEDEEEQLGTRNYYSNLYRKLENYNLAVTVQQTPLIGIGFGTRYEQPLSLVRIGYSLRDFMAHNNVVWLLVKIGGIGFFFFWLLLDSYACRATSLLHRINDPYLKVLCAVVIVGIINQIVAAYFDLHLVRYRTMLLMGILMGLLPAIQSAAGETATEPNRKTPS